MEELFVKKAFKGEIIFKEGDREPVMYHLVSGKVGIYANYGKTNEKDLAVLTADDPSPYFGEMGLIDRTVRSATVVALEDCRLGCVTSDTLRFYLKKHPDLILSMLHRMSSCLRGMTEQYMEACHCIALQEEARKASKKPDAAWMKTLKKYTAIFDDPPTEAELAALAIPPRYPVKKPVPVRKETADSASVLEIRTLPADTVIFEKGDVADCMYELVEGSVAFYADYGLPTQKKLSTSTAEKDRFFGEMGLIDVAPRAATAVTETDCKMLTIRQEDLDPYFVEEPEHLLAVMRQMSGRIRTTTQNYMEAVKTIAENERYEQLRGNKPEWLAKNLLLFTDLWDKMSRLVEH